MVQAGYALNDDNESNVLGTLTPKHVHLLPAVVFQFHLEEGMDMSSRRRIKRNK